MVLAEWLVVHSSQFSHGADRLALGVTVDLVLLVPLLYYWLLVRTGHWSKTSVVAVFAGCVGVAKWLLPAAHHTYVDKVTYIVPVLEAGVLLYFLWHGAALLRSYKQHQQVQADFIQSLQLSLLALTGNSRLSHIVATEASVLRYSVLGWLTEKSATDQRVLLPSHRNSGQIAMLIMVIVVAGIESVVAHLLLARWSETAAWILTATSVYTVLFLIAETVTTVRRPSFQQDGMLHLRFGLRWAAVLSLDNISHIERINEKPASNKHTLTGPLLVQPNVLITLHKPVVVTGLYGLQKSVTRIALLIDSPNSLSTVD
jgi:hypothetical protein